MRHDAALQHQSRYAAQARIAHHATCAYAPDHPCTRSEELRSWDAGIAAAIAADQRQDSAAPPPLRPTWLNAFQLWYAALLRAQRLPTAGAVAPWEQQAIKRQVEQISLAVRWSGHTQHTPARWRYDAWLATYYGDEADHANP